MEPQSSIQKKYHSDKKINNHEYKNNNQKDFVEMKKIMHDIRNNRKLTSSQIDLIETYSHEDKMQIILLYDEVFEQIIQLIEQI